MRPMCEKPFRFPRLTWLALAILAGGCASQPYTQGDSTGQLVADNAVRYGSMAAAGAGGYFAGKAIGDTDRRRGGGRGRGSRAVGGQQVQRSEAEGRFRARSGRRQGSGYGRHFKRKMEERGGVRHSARRKEGRVSQIPDGVRSLPERREHGRHLSRVVSDGPGLPLTTRTEDSR
ncbi:protein of unknown function [Methylacidimicrobium sp. AP8]|nr:protein of unknown function [Methylacidimicrobium sp. AP8]